LALRKSPGVTARARAAKRRAKLRVERTVKAAVRERDGGFCRVCGRPAESVHEIRPKSLGGPVSLENSIALCGDGTHGCHGLAQRHQIAIRATDQAVDGRALDANQAVYVTCLTPAAQQHAGYVAGWR